MKIRAIISILLLGLFLTSFVNEVIELEEIQEFNIEHSEKEKDSEKEKEFEDDNLKHEFEFDEISQLNFPHFSNINSHYYYSELYKSISRNTAPPPPRC